MGSEAAQPERERSWDGLIRREIDVELRVLGEEDRSVEVIASTEDLDSHGDVLKQFWDLSRFEKNPVVLWNHNMFESSAWSFGGAVRPEDLFPIGRAEETRVEGKKLKSKLILGSEEYSEIAQKVFLGCKQKIIRAVSVGFKPGDVKPVRNVDGSIHHYELGSAEKPNELREISFVPMGSNPAAVAKSIAFERKGLASLVAKIPAAESGTQTEKSMTEEQMKAAVAAAKAEADALRTELGAVNQKSADADTRLKTVTAERDTAQKALADEKAVSAKLETELKASGERATKAEALIVESTVAGYVGKKLTPAEKDEYVELAKSVGIDRVKSILDKRPDLTLLAPVEVDGKKVGDPTPAPAPTDGSTKSASADLAEMATKAVDGNRAA